MDQARRTKTRATPEHALELWRGLVAGQWSLIEHWESGGRRYIAAYSNGPGGRDPRAAALPLARRHQQGGELGARSPRERRFGERAAEAPQDRPALARRADRRAHPSRATRLDVQVGDDQVGLLAFDTGVDDALRTRLTKAEREIAELVARGWSNARIAQARAVAASTVTKQLQAIFDKLGVGSRSRRAWAIAQG
jgi:ATP/maltotriose-dependent transcriptional regulator MalT